MNNEKALSAYLEKMAEIETLITSLRVKADDHFGNDPEFINYGHVGDLGRIKNALTEANLIAGGR